jgi:hypothetical protein
MDRIVNKTAALGVPGLVLLVTMAVTGWAGASALTTALVVLGDSFGMLGGIGVLGILALISKGLSDFGFEAIFKATLEELSRKGKSKEDIEREIESYPISYDLKLKTKNYLQTIG